MQTQIRFVVCCTIEHKHLMVESFDELAIHQVFYIMVLHTQVPCNHVVIAMCVVNCIFHQSFLACSIHQFIPQNFAVLVMIVHTYTYVHNDQCSVTSPGVVIITIPACPLPIELVATTENL